MKGHVVPTNPNAFCLYETDTKYVETIDFDVSWFKAMTAPCRVLDISRSYCGEVVDLTDANSFYIVNFPVVKTNRRLLSDRFTFQNFHDTMHTTDTISTFNGLCQDALAPLTDDKTDLQHTRKACEQAYEQSRMTMRLINATDILPVCMFCSSEDLLQAALTHSDQILLVLQHPKHVLYVLLRHGPFQKVVILMRKYLKMGTYMWHDWQQTNEFVKGTNLSTLLHTEYFAHVSSVFASVNGLSQASERPTWPSRLATPAPETNTTQHTHANQFIETPAYELNELNDGSARKLLGLDNALQASKRRIDDMFSLHDAYASQLAQSFDYEYANLYTSATQEAWQMTWPPQYDHPLSDQCTLFYDLFGILQIAASNATFPFSNAGRAVKGVPVTQLSDAWPVIQPAPSDLQNNASIVYEGDEVARIWVQLVKSVMDGLKITTQHVYDLFFATTQEGPRFVLCDFEAVQTCKNWKVIQFHSSIILGLFFSVWFIIATNLRFSFIASMSIFIFVPVIMYMSFGYSPLCFPMIPTCFFEDVLMSLRLMFPRVLVIPNALIRNAIVEIQPGFKQPCYEVLETNALNDGAAFAHSLQCIKRCSEPPLEFSSWRSVFAWCIVELGQNTVDFFLSFIDDIPLIDHEDLRIQIFIKGQIWAQRDNDLLLAHRICAGVQSFRLIAIFMLLIFVVLLAQVVTQMLLLGLIPVIQCIGQLFTSIFTTEQETEAEQE